MFSAFWRLWPIKSSHRRGSWVWEATIGCWSTSHVNIQSITAENDCLFTKRNSRKAENKAKWKVSCKLHIMISETEISQYPGFEKPGYGSWRTRFVGSCWPTVHVQTQSSEAYQNKHCVSSNFHIETKSYSIIMLSQLQTIINQGVFHQNCAVYPTLRLRV